MRIGKGRDYFNIPLGVIYKIILIIIMFICAILGRMELTIAFGVLILLNKK